MIGIITDEFLKYNKWKNIEYDFNGHSNNCTWNIQVYKMVIDYEIKLNCH